MGLEASRPPGPPSRSLHRSPGASPRPPHLPCRSEPFPHPPRPPTPLRASGSYNGSVGLSLSLEKEQAKFVPDRFLPLMLLKASRPCFQTRNSAPNTSFQAQTRSLFKVGSIRSGHHLKKRNGRDKSSLPTQIQLFKIGSIQSRHRLKKTKGLEPPPNPNWHPSGLDKSSLQTQIQLFKIGNNQSGHHLKKIKSLEPPPNPNWHPFGLDKSSLQTQIQLFEIGSIQSGHRLKKTKSLEPPPNSNWHLWSGQVQLPAS